MEMEKDYEKNWVRLPLVFASNVRELGGYPVEEGGQTAYHRFLRADDISELSESDIQFLLRYGVTSVLDLRSDGEVCRKPDVLAGVSGVLWKNVPFLRGEAGDMSRYAGEGAVADLGEMYLQLLEDREKIKEIFTFIADVQEGCLLFHCAGGKDRTGVLALLLMMLAGADKQDCMTNYGQSYVNLSRKRQDFFDDYEVEMPPEAMSLMYSHPETIALCYDHIMECYGGIRQYLTYCGLEEGQIEGIDRRLVN